MAIPIGIHLLSRKEGKTIRIGSLRFLAETSTSKFSSIRLNEVVLLALRSLLIILIVVFLAGLLVEKTNAKTSRKWAVIEKGLENESRIKTLTDSLRENGFEIRTLAAGFPATDNDTAKATADYYKLAEALAKENNLQAVVVATNSLSGFKGKRDPLPENITWLTYPVAKANAWLTTDDEKSDTLHINLVFEKKFEADKKIMEAALTVIQESAPKKISITETTTQNFQASDTSNWTIWLSTEQPTPINKLLYFKENPFDNLISVETKNTAALTKRLTTENAVEQHLPVQLMELLFQEEIKKEIAVRDTRTVANELAWSDATVIQRSNAAADKQPVDKILFACIALLFIAERILAFYRKQ